MSIARAISRLSAAGRSPLRVSASRARTGRLVGGSKGALRGPEIEKQIRGAPRLGRRVSERGGLRGPFEAPFLNNLPARARERSPGSPLELLADLLHLREKPRLVDECLAIGVDHHLAVDDDRVHAAAVGVVDEVVDRIEERLPLRTL